MHRVAGWHKALMERIGDKALMERIGDKALMEMIGDTALMEMIGDTALMETTGDTALMEMIAGRTQKVRSNTSIRYKEMTVAQEPSNTR